MQSNIVGRSFRPIARWQLRHSDRRKFFCSSSLGISFSNPLQRRCVSSYAPPLVYIYVYIYLSFSPSLRVKMKKNARNNGRSGDNGERKRERAKEKEIIVHSRDEPKAWYRGIWRTLNTLRYSDNGDFIIWKISFQSSSNLHSMQDWSHFSLIPVFLAKTNTNNLQLKIYLGFIYPRILLATVLRSMKSNSTCLIFFSHDPLRSSSCERTKILLHLDDHRIR